MAKAQLNLTKDMGFRQRVSLISNLLQTKVSKEANAFEIVFKNKIEERATFKAPQILFGEVSLDLAKSVWQKVKTVGHSWANKPGKQTWIPIERIICIKIL